MDLPRNSFKRAIAAGRQQIGLWVSLASAYSIEVCAGAGFDWLVIDTEHSPNEVDTTLAQLQACAAYPSHPVVRAAWNDTVLVKRHLDIGAQTLLLPYVQTEDEARAAVAAMHYPPEGVRGVAGSTRATRFGRIKDYSKRAASELCLIVQIETRTGLDNLEAIARVDGVDGLFIGPSDLAADLGHLGDNGHPEVRAAIEGAVGRIRAAGKAAGILAPVEADARHWIEVGCRFVGVGNDAAVLARQTEALAAKFKVAPAAR